MVCPKCGHNGPDGLECSACGVIFDKFRRQGGAPGQPPVNIASTGGALPIPRLLPKSRHDKERKRPIGQTILRGLVLIVVLGGLGALLDYLRLHLLGNKISACLKAAQNSKMYRDRHLDEKVVMEQILGEARNQNYEFPVDRLWMRIRPKNLDTGSIVNVELKVLVRAKLMGLFKHDIYREGGTGVLLRNVKGFSGTETPKSEPIAQDLDAAGKL